MYVVCDFYIPINKLTTESRKVKMVTNPTRVNKFASVSHNTVTITKYVT